MKPLLGKREEGLQDIDHEIYNLLRKANKPLYLVVNKVDSAKEMLAATEFLSIRSRKYYTLSSATGSGTGELLDDLVADSPTTEYKDPFKVYLKLPLQEEDQTWENLHLPMHFWMITETLLQISQVQPEIPSKRYIINSGTNLCW